MGAGGAGAGGGAGQGGGGGGGFQCLGVTLDGDCSSFPVGLVCILGGEAQTPCTCLPGTGAPAWQCGGSLCPSSVPGSGSTCSAATISAIANFGGCKYPPAEVCRCDTAGAGAAWSCNDVSCPAAPPTGTCSPAQHAAGLHCVYAGAARDCACSPSDGGGSRWSCNGQSTPDCPSAWPGSSADCSAFAAGTVCAYPAANVSGGPCTCTSQGATQTWQCAGG